jgi:hypothetical protein
MNPQRSTPNDLAGQRHIPIDPEDPIEEILKVPEDRPWTSAEAADWLLSLGEEERLATLGRWAADLDRLDEEILNLLATLGSYRRLAQEEIVAERDALANRIAHCCQVLADLPGPEPEPGSVPDRGPTPPAA